MSRVVILADTHYGVRNDGEFFLDNHKQFFEGVFFPYLREHRHDVGAVVHLGDLFDRRKYVNHNTLNRIKRDFLGPLEEWADGSRAACYFLAGNHDCYYRDSNGINAVTEHVGDRRKNFHVVDDDVARATVDGVPLLLVPWISPGNSQRVRLELDAAREQAVFGHFELRGFDMGSGALCEHGLDPHDALGKFDTVVSGHFHKRQSAGNVTYVGAVGEYTWNDHGQSRGFAVLDVGTRSLTFIDNPYTIHTKVWYDGPSTPVPAVSGKIVKLFVQSRQDTEHFDEFVTATEAQGPQSLEIIDAAEVSMISVTELSDTDDVLRTFDEVIGQIDSIDRDVLGRLVRELYTEAIGAVA